MQSSNSSHANQGQNSDVYLRNDGERKQHENQYLFSKRDLKTYISSTAYVLELISSTT
jgi:hypothetical protein